MALIVAAAAAAPASASFPGRNGRIFFSSVRADGSLEIFSMRPDGSSEKRLTRSRPPGNHPAWSPDANRIAFLVNDPSSQEVYDVWVMRRDGTGLVRVAGSVSEFGKLAWSPDGRRLAFACPAGRHATGLCLVRSNATHLRRITRPHIHQRDSSPTWSPDGKRIAFARNNGGRGSTLFTWSMRTGKLRALMQTRKGDLESPAWSRQGRIAFTRDQQDIFVMRPDGRDKRNLTRTREGLEVNPSWSPDGRQIVFEGYYGSADDSGLFVINADGTDRKHLAFTGADPLGDPVIPVHPAWSPAGDEIALDDRYGGIWLLKPDGSGAEQLLRSDWGHWTPAVSPDGSTVAFPDGVDGFFLMNADGTNLRPASTGGWSNPSWAPDGRRVAADDSWGDIWLFNAYGTGDDLIDILQDEGPGDPSNYDPAWSPNGAEIAYTSEDGQGSYISVYSLKTGTDRDLTTGREPTWSPDGKKIAYDSGKGIAVMSRNGSDNRYLVGNASQPAWSPDGKKIAFVRYLGKNSEIYVMNVNGSGLRRLTHNPGADLFPDWQSLH